jgi:hypothetical protein
MQMSVTVHRVDLQGNIYRKEARKLVEVRPTADPTVAGLIVLLDDLGRRVHYDAGNGQPLDRDQDSFVPPPALKKLNADFTGKIGQPSLPGIEPSFLAPGKHPRKPKP